MGQEVERASKLLGRAYADGELSQETKQTLTQVGNIADQLDPALGREVDARDPLIVTTLIDDSLSITEAPYGAEAVRLGHNLCLNAFTDSPSRSILAHTRYLTKGTLFPYQDAATAPRLGEDNYHPVAPSTPLYRQAVITLGAVLAKVRAERERRQAIRAFTLLLTDGFDNASGDITSSHVRFLVRDMLEFSDEYIVAGMGIGDPDRFRDIFLGMGIPNLWIFTPDATTEDIQRVFTKKVIPALALASQATELEWDHLLEAGPPGDDG